VDDDPVAVESVLLYLYTLNTEYVDYPTEQVEHGSIPKGYLKYYLEAFRIAEKYGLDLLAEYIAQQISTPLLCSDCERDEEFDERSFPPDHCVDLGNEPEALLEAVVTAQGLGDSRRAHKVQTWLLNQAAAMTQQWNRWGSNSKKWKDHRDEAGKIDEILLKHPMLALNIMSHMARNVLVGEDKWERSWPNH
jgi:hypothetical protein